MHLQIKNYSGKISKGVFDCMHIDPTKKLFFIAESCQIPFSEDQVPPFDLDFGLDPKLLELPQYTSIANMETRLRRAPGHIQSLQGQMRNIVQSPNAFYTYTGKALRMLLRASIPAANVLNPNQEYGLFENPDYNVLVSLPVEEKEALNGG
jgi:hypothetical protein